MSGAGRIRLGTRHGAALGERAAGIAAGTLVPAAPRDAATVVLVRPAPGGGCEVYLLRRAASMAFAAGACVFPGGSVDARDGEQEVAWAGPGAGQWGAVLGAGPELARSLLCAAVRETFEESGVLLAGPSPAAAVPATDGADWEEDRQALLRRSLSLAGLLRRRALVLRSDLLRAWSHWITPEAEERRYDTRFFVAALPEGQSARDVSGEADKVAWLRPEAALDLARAGTITLMPPTAVTLAEVAACGSIGAVMAARREIRPRQPVITAAADGVWLELPGGLENPL